MSPKESYRIMYGVLRSGYRPYYSLPGSWRTFSLPDARMVNLLDKKAAGAAAQSYVLRHSQDYYRANGWRERRDPTWLPF